MLENTAALIFFKTVSHSVYDYWLTSLLCFITSINGCTPKVTVSMPRGHTLLNHVLTTVQSYCANTIRTSCLHTSYYYSVS